MNKEPNTPNASDMRELFPDAQFAKEMEHLLQEVERSNKICASFEIGNHSGSITIALNDGFALHFQPIGLNTEGTYSWVSKAFVSMRGANPIETAFQFNALVTLERPEGQTKPATGDTQFAVSGRTLLELVGKALQKIEAAFNLPLVALPSPKPPLVFRAS